MIRYITAYFATLIVFVAIDAVWLSIMANALYKPTLGDILLPEFAPAPAVAFYLIFIVGVVIFAVSPAIKSGEWTSALLYGALFGFFAYGVYDFTNMATLRNWTATITLADVCWGTVLTGISATLGYLVSGVVLRGFHVAG